MLNALPLVAAIALVACGAGREAAPQEPSARVHEMGVDAVAVVEPGAVPAMAEAPDLQPGSVLGEKLNWSREDFSLAVYVTINQSGSVLAAELASVSPRGHALAIEFGEFVTAQLKTARFEAPTTYAYPHSFLLTVNVPAPRDASGSLK